MDNSNLGIVSADAVPFSTTAQGAVLVDSAQYYTAPLSDAWAYVQDLSLVASGRPPRFVPSRVSISPELADTLLANATATLEAQLLAGGPAVAENMLRSMNDFLGSGGSLEGLEIPYFSTAITMLDQPNAEQLLDESARAFLKAGGLDGVFHSFESLTAGRFRTNDIFPILDAASGQLGLPAVSDVVAAIGAAGEIFKHPEQFALHAGETLEAAVHGVKAPGHRLFSSVSHTLTMISPSVGEAFRDFRHSDVGKFVETVGSIALGIGMVVAAPIVATVKAGVHIAEGAVAFFKGVWDAIFGSDDDRQREHPSPTPAPMPRAGGHPLSDDDRKKIKDGTHAIVGCWVEDPFVMPDGPIRRKPQDGSCPEPDLSEPVPFPAPDPQSAWPSTPQPRVSGPGILALMSDISGKAPLSFEFNPSDGFTFESLGGNLGWNEEAAIELASTLEKIGYDLPDELDALTNALQGHVPRFTLPSVSERARVAVTVIPQAKRVWIIAAPIPRGAGLEVVDTGRAVLVDLGSVGAELRRVPDIAAELAHARQAIISELGYAVAWGLTDTDPIQTATRRPLDFVPVPDVAALVDEFLVRLRAPEG